MGRIRRRTVLGGAAAVTAAGALSAACAPAPRKGTVDDVRHVVVLMQENRSFDHYYGTMAGVRGFGDRAALRDVFRQRGDKGGPVLPFRIDTSVVDGQDLGELPHDWNSTHRAWNGGGYDRWTAAKSPMTMGYFTGDDIPFQHALAAAFTLCDHYFCSIQGPTHPNRLYHWTGTIDPDGLAGGPATHNAPDYEPSFRWTTYPERLEAAGISWRIYANDEERGVPEHFVGDYGDNPLWLFQSFHDALYSMDPVKRRLAERGNLRKQLKPDSGKGKDLDHVLAEFIADCAAGTLPAVSWVVAPYGYCEHPAARPVDGAAYVQRMLKALWDKPDLWESTVVFINYDENDGFFDHVVPPTPPPGTPGEYLPGNRPEKGEPSGPPLPIGLGPRVPMTVVSPWSRGGWVNSQVFDHTSVLRFLETWTGVREPNISAWRRAICGDLTSCFDFRTPDTTIPLLPDANALRAEADRTQRRLPKPGLGPAALVQDPGTAKARPLPYQPVAWVTADPQALHLHLANHGTQALQLAAYAYHAGGASQRFDVGPKGELTGEVAHGGTYDVAIHGPNGFVVEASGGLDLDAAVTYTGTPALRVTVTNRGPSPVTLNDVTLPPGGAHDFPVPTSNGWYDVTFETPGWRRRFAGHLEDGRPSRTGP
ncbi:MULTISPECIES: phosphocholine-specific phospholipase C [Amycolatopsis]|uniref:phospholipase C n=1 Tax=Amycolatopsis bullii TaxID=941987 RepID=A0ABQ3KMV3_9PSEU|nr:phospholipase C, phosphocholine-specific [Amycolatopsis bullii]GHG38636.1 phospholipase C, phosphocholine-specific [Amycolatopsis bullii]